MTSRPLPDPRRLRRPGWPGLLGAALILLGALVMIGWVRPASATTRADPAANPSLPVTPNQGKASAWNMPVPGEVACNGCFAPTKNDALVGKNPFNPFPESIDSSAPITTTPPITNTLFFIQPGVPAAIPNFLQPDKGCAWAGIGGQVFDLNGQPVSGMMVRLSGTWQGAPVSKYAVTNSSQGFGPGGYDLYLGAQPLAANTLTLVLVDVEGHPRSIPTRLTTSAACTGNLLVVNLREWAVKANLYYPVIRK